MLDHQMRVELNNPQGLTYQYHDYATFNSCNVSTEENPATVPRVQKIPNNIEEDKNPKKPKRVRTYFTNYQLIALEEQFLRNKYLTRTMRIRLSRFLNLQERQIKIWFQNRRTKLKRLKAKAPNSVTVHQNNNSYSSSMDIPCDMSKYYLPVSFPPNQMTPSYPTITNAPSMHYNEMCGPNYFKNVSSTCRENMQGLQTDYSPPDEEFTALTASYYFNLLPN